MQILFDTRAQKMRRARALQGNHDWFLHRSAIDEIDERLQEINRTFKDVTIAGWRQEDWCDQWPTARFIPDTDTLDLEPDSCDLILHALCLHTANDPVGQLVQMRRALRPDGLMIAVLFGGQTLQELRQALAYGETQVEGGLSPRINPMGEIRDLGALLQRAGFSLPVADSVPLTLSYPNPLALMKDVQGMGESNVLSTRRKQFLKRETLAKAVEWYDHTYGQDGRVPATMELVFLTGWSPDASQQKPLRPGSAQARLADALGVPEQSS